MNVENCTKMRDKAQVQVRFFKQWFNEMAEELPDETASELRRLLEEALFWQGQVVSWQHGVEFWQAKEVRS